MRELKEKNIKHKNIIISIGIIVFSIMLYANSLCSPLLWDDEETVIGNGFIRSITHLKDIFLSSYHGGAGNESNIYRPLVTVSFMVEYHLWKLNSCGYHTVNVLLHAINGALVFCILLLIGGNTLFSFLVAILFVAHPIQTEVVNYVSHRTELLMLFFFLLSAILFIHSQQGSKNRKAICYILSIIAFCASILSKEMGMSLPLFFVIILFYRNELRWRKVVELLAFAIIVAAYVVVRIKYLNFTGADVADYAAGADLRIVPLSIVAILMRYLRIFIFPFDLHMERDIPIVNSWYDLYAWLLVGAFLLIVYVVFHIACKDKRVLLGGLWFVVSYIPVANLFPLQIAVAEHYMYLPSIGIFIIVSAALCNLFYESNWQTKRILILCGISILLACCIVTIRRNRDWQDPKKLYASTIKHSQNCFRVNNNMGVEYFREGNVQEGKRYFLQSLDINPKYVPALNNVGVCFEREKEYVKAFEYYQTALAYNPDYFLSYKNLGFLLLKFGEKDKAKKAFLKANSIYSFDPRVEYVLSEIDDLY